MRWVVIPITVPTGARPGYVTAFETVFCISRSGGGCTAVLVGNRNGAAPHCQPCKEQRCSPHQIAQFRFGLCNGRAGHTPSIRAALRPRVFLETSILSRRNRCPRRCWRQGWTRANPQVVVAGRDLGVETSPTSCSTRAKARHLLLLAPLAWCCCAGAQDSRVTPLRSSSAPSYFVGAAHSGARLGRRKPASVQAMTGGMNMACAECAS